MVNASKYTSLMHLMGFSIEQATVIEKYSLGVLILEDHSHKTLDSLDVFFFPFWCFKVTFLSPNVGGHQQPLKGSLIPKRSQRIAKPFWCTM